MLRALLAVCLLTVASPVLAATIVLDLEEEVPGLYGNYFQGTALYAGGFVSHECGGCALLVGSGLEVGSFGTAGDGRSVRAGTASGIAGGFDLYFRPEEAAGIGTYPDMVGLSSVVGVTIAFGNDDLPSLIVGPSQELLFPTYMDMVLVALDANSALIGSARVRANNNHLMDQSISITTATPIAYLSLGFVTYFPWDGREGYIPGVLEVVDNIVIETVPEPGIAALLAGAVLVAACRRRG